MLAHGYLPRGGGCLPVGELLRWGRREVVFEAVRRWFCAVRVCVCRERAQEPQLSSLTANILVSREGWIACGVDRESIFASIWLAHG